MITEQTRFKFGMILIGVIFVEGVIKAFVGGFPFVEAIAAQGAVYTTFAIVKSITDVKNPAGEANGGNCAPEDK